MLLLRNVFFLFNRQSCDRYIYNNAMELSGKYIRLYDFTKLNHSHIYIQNNNNHNAYIYSVKQGEILNAISVDSGGRRACF